MGEQDWLAARFEERRGRLRSVAYRLLGSLAEADDAVQEAWLRLGRTDHTVIANLDGWLTTVVARVCLNMLQSRRARREEPFDAQTPEPIIGRADGANPEQEALLADAVGLALMVVLDTLAPAERLAFVLHDLFAVPFEDIAPLIERTPVAARQLASRARRRVRGASAPTGDAQAGQRAVVEAFLAAAREGDFAALLAVLDPDVVLRADRGAALAGAPTIIRGAQTVIRGAHAYASQVRAARLALVNGAPGIVSWGPDGRPFSVMGFTVARGRIVEIDVLVDPARLAQLDLTALAD